MRPDQFIQKKTWFKLIFFLTKNIVLRPLFFFFLGLNVYWYFHVILVNIGFCLWSIVFFLFFLCIENANLENESNKKKNKYCTEIMYKIFSSILLLIVYISSTISFVFFHVNLQENNFHDKMAIFKKSFYQLSSDC